MNNEKSKPVTETGPLNCLIVDDSAFARQRLKKLMEKLMEMRDCIANEAATGREAIQAYQRFKPDLVLMDIVMPDLEGVEAVRLICETDPGARVIMMSSLSYQDKVAEAMAAGARDFIPKPVTGDQLREAINRVLQLPAEV
ncbi:MAG TPA: response regulator [Blastocatellia bacterium]|nr:response regulator [Blastocatellia bacterium]